MKAISVISTVALLVGLTTVASAQEDRCSAAPHEIDTRDGECSPGTQVPSTEALIAALRGQSNTRLQGALEYAERLDAYQAVPDVIQVVFTNEDARSREFAAWWLRRRTFSLSWVVRMFRETLEGSYTHAQISRIQAARTAAGLQPIPEATLRARAAEALGEILVPSAAAPLQVAATRDPEVIVRLAAVGAIGRLNHTMSGTVLAQALGDADASVRQVALKNVLLVNSFRDRTSLVGALADADAANRREAALLVGELRVEAAVPALGGLVRGDEDASVRRAAAWALGRIGTGEARTTLTEVAASEADRGVLDAIEIARQMR